MAKEFELDFGTQEEVSDIQINSRGDVLPPKNDKIALIDADTIAFAACVVHERMSEEDVGVGEVKFEEVWTIDIEEAFKHAMDTIKTIMDNTGCQDFELHFTKGRESFRYTLVDPEYKANRLNNGTRAPVGLSELKELLCIRYPDKAFSWREWEADDIVVFKKTQWYDKYIMCAVDKDVLYSVPGTHFNYYSSTKFNIKMKFYDVSEKEAIQHHYIQTLTGDTGDNVIGLKGVGKKTAEKMLGSIVDRKILWDKVTQEYRNKGRDDIDAIKNMRLVNMHQLVMDESNQIKVKLWRQDNE